MSRENIIRVVGDLENFIDRLLSHQQEENCTHSINDLLEEFFDNKNKNKNKKGMYGLTRSVPAKETTYNPQYQGGL